MSSNEPTNLPANTPNKYPPWAPRFWNGMRVRDYWGLLRANRFRIHPLKYGMTFMVGGCSLINSTLSRVQNLAYGKTIERTELAGPPLFVIGHWRSGTTLMHELLSLDPNRAYPCNLDAFVPNHFLVSRPVMYPLVKMLLPSKRPMDNMALDVASPQEDDFALCTLGAPTPYRRIAFPNQPNRDHLQLNLKDADSRTQKQLRVAMDRFLKTLTLQYQLPLVLKSPPHTGRLQQLAEWFPDAKFIHLSRHPYKLVPSTIRLWRLLDEIQGFQIPRYDETWLKNYVFECKDLMYSAYLEQRKYIPQNRLIEVRFEDLISDPLQQMKRVYSELELTGYETVQPHFKSYFEQRKNHKRNPFTMPPDLKADIDSNWQEYMEAFDYRTNGVHHESQ